MRNRSSAGEGVSDANHPLRLGLMCPGYIDAGSWTLSKVVALGVGMIEKFAPPQVFIRRYTASEICDVVVSVRHQEIVLRCPNYSQALKWARLECKSYKIPQPDIELLISEPEIEPLGGLDHDEELPLFLRSSRNN